jgi:mannose-1-phosphate guanylyltransferase
MKIIAIILCGGSGSRLFPLSRSNKPKQFLELENEFSLLQNTLKRLAITSIDFEKIVLISNKQSEYIIDYQLKNIKLEIPIEIIFEPTSQNTAPAIGFVLKYFYENQNFNGNLLFLPSDHIYEQDAFDQLLSESKNFLNEQALIFGIQPTYAETGYGYIQFDNHQVISFKEKPNKELAEQYLLEKNYNWNSGMFMFNKNILESFKKYNSNIDTILTFILDKSIIYNNKIFIHSDYSKCTDISIDYALMEHISSETKFLSYKGYWSDIGSYQSLIPYSKYYISFNSKNNYVNTKKTTIVSDVKDLIIVETDDILLISDIKDSQNIKNIYNKIPKNLLKNEKIDYRPWGYYEVLNDEQNFKSKRITVFPYKRLSLQSHQFRAEHWICLEGNGKAEINDIIYELIPNKQVFINFGDKHRMINDGNSNLVIIEIQTGTYFGEDDIIRYQDDYGRN